MLLLYQPERQSYQGLAEGCAPCPITLPGTQQMMIKNQNPQLDFHQFPSLPQSSLSFDFSEVTHPSVMIKIVQILTYSDFMTINKVGPNQMNS